MRFKCIFGPMNFWASTLIFLLSSVAVSSQGSNPFELNAHSSAFKDSSRNIGELLKDSANVGIAKTVNPFEIGISRSNSMELPSMRNESPEDKSGDSEGSGTKKYKIRYLFYFLFSLLITGLCISSNRYRFNQILKSIWNSIQLFNLYREADAWKNGQSIVLYLLFILNAGVFIHLISLNELFPGLTDLKLGYIFLGLSLVYLIRHITMMVLSWVYPLNPTIGIYNYSIGVNNMIAGVVFLPLTLFAVFGPGSSENIFIYIGLVFFFLLYLIRQMKGLLLALGMKGFNLMYFFIYLCAIDIAPILLIWRMTSGAS